MNPPQQSITIGNCQLQSSTTHKQANHISPYLRTILEKDQWNLGDREFRDLSADQIFHNASYIAATVIWLDFNKKPNIIEEIIQPKYTRLTILYLGDNNINTIQPLASLDSLLLQKLYLNNNKISSIKPIRKCVFPKLLELNFNGNYIQEQKWIIQADFSCIDKLSLGYKRNNQKINEFPWFLKAKIKDQTQIFSSRHKMHSFNRLVYYNNMKESISKRIHPKDLFKTFQN